MLLPVPAGGGFVEEGGSNTGDSGVTTVTAHATNADEKGTAVQMIASTLYESAGIIVSLFIQGTSARYLTDVLIGTDVLIANIPSHLMVDSLWGRTSHHQYFFPVRIPQGSQIQLQTQSSTANLTIEAQVTLISTQLYGPSPFNRVTTYGAVTASSGGTVVDPGGSSNTKVNTQIDASCANPLKAIMLAQTNDQTDGSVLNAGRLTDVLAGASSAETILIPDQHGEETSIEMCLQPMPFPVPCDVPAGTRLSVDHQYNGNNATDRLCRVILFGFD